MAGVGAAHRVRSNELSVYEAAGLALAGHAQLVRGGRADAAGVHAAPLARRLAAAVEAQLHGLLHALAGGVEELSHKGALFLGGNAPYLMAPSALLSWPALPQEPRTKPSTSRAFAKPA